MADKVSGELAGMESEEIRGTAVRDIPSPDTNFIDTLILDSGPSRSQEHISDVCEFVTAAQMDGDRSSREDGSAVTPESLNIYNPSLAARALEFPLKSSHPALWKQGSSSFSMTLGHTLFCALQ